MYAMIADPDGRVREPVGAWRDLTLFRKVFRFPKHLARNVVKIRGILFSQIFKRFEPLSR